MSVSGFDAACCLTSIATTYLTVGNVGRRRRLVDVDDDDDDSTSTCRRPLGRRRLDFDVSSVAEPATFSRPRPAASGRSTARHHRDHRVAHAFICSSTLLHLDAEVVAVRARGHLQLDPHLRRLEVLDRDRLLAHELRQLHHGRVHARLAAGGRRGFGELGLERGEVLCRKVSIRSWFSAARAPMVSEMAASPSAATAAVSSSMSSLGVPFYEAAWLPKSRVRRSERDSGAGGGDLGGVSGSTWATALTRAGAHKPENFILPRRPAHSPATAPLHRAKVVEQQPDRRPAGADAIARPSRWR